MSAARKSQEGSTEEAKRYTPEEYLSLLLRAAGLRQRHDRSLPGQPEFVFPDARVVVFVKKHPRTKRPLSGRRHTRTLFWRERIGPKLERDNQIYRKLARLGWKVVRIWEHQVEGAALNCVRRIASALGANKVDWGEVKAKQKALPPFKRQ